MLFILLNPQIGPLSGAITLGQSGPGSNSNEGVLRIPQSSSTAGTSPSDCLVLYPGHSLGGVLPLCREAVGVFYSRIAPRPFDRAVWHSCRMGGRNQDQTRGRIGPQFRLGNLRVGELHFCPLCHPCTALDQASSLSRHLGSWNCLPHQAHIALSEPISSTDQQGSSLDSFPTSPPLYHHFNRPSGFWPCVKSCLVGGSDK